MSISEELKSRIDFDGMELVDLIAVPTGSDQMVRYRTIQEVLSEFEAGEDKDSLTYVLQIRKQRMKPSVETVASPTMGDAMYLANGRLNTEFLFANAKVLFQAGEYSAARQIYTALMKSGDRTPEGLLGIARCFEGEGKTDKALKAYDDSVLYYPSIDAYRSYATLLIQLQKEQQAAEILERALIMKDLNDKTRYDLHQAAGNTWLRSGVVGKAERNYRKALELNPHSDAVAANLGVLCLQQNRFDEAKVAFEEAIRVNPENEKAWFGLGSLHLALGNQIEALKAFSESLQIKIQQPQAIFHLVKCAYETKNYAEARGLLKSYVEVSPFNPHLLYSLAGLEFHLGDYAAAMRTAETILKIQPGHNEAEELMKRIKMNS